jgi:hypothetical protein
MYDAATWSEKAAKPARCAETGLSHPPFWKAGEAPAGWSPVCACGVKIDLDAPIAAQVHGQRACRPAG